MDAAMHGHTEVIKLLLKAGVPVITTKQVMAILLMATLLMAILLMAILLMAAHDSLYN